MTFIPVGRPSISQPLEADASSSHAVSQLVLVPHEGHEADVSLDVDVVIQDQDAVRLPRDRLHGVDFLRHIPQLLTKIVNLWMKGERIRN